MEAAEAARRWYKLRDRLLGRWCSPNWRRGWGFPRRTDGGRLAVECRDRLAHRLKRCERLEDGRLCRHFRSDYRRFIGSGPRLRLLLGRRALAGRLHPPGELFHDPPTLAELPADFIAPGFKFLTRLLLPAQQKILPYDHQDRNQSQHGSEQETEEVYEFEHECDPRRPTV